MSDSAILEAVPDVLPASDQVATHADLEAMRNKFHSDLVGLRSKSTSQK